MKSSISGSSACHLLFNPEDGGDIFHHQFTSYGLHNNISQMTELILLYVHVNLYAIFTHCQITDLDIMGK
jgi:hypothetical protein